VLTQTSVVEKLVSQIVEIVHPLRIVLFGSAAKGNMGPNSDIDLMVVMPEGTHRRHTAQKLYRDIKGFKVPFDVVVATPSDLARYGNSPGLIYRDVLFEGKEVYAA
jgi:uncharacterized protein